MIIDTSILPDGHRQHITQLMELLDAHAELRRANAVLLKHHPEEGETCDGLDKSLERVLAKPQITRMVPHSILGRQLYAALAALTVCAKTSGPVGTTVYFISDERMEAARAAVLAWESSRGVITGSDETSPPSINS